MAHCRRANVIAVDRCRHKKNPPPNVDIYAESDVSRIIFFSFVSKRNVQGLVGDVEDVRE